MTQLQPLRPAEQLSALCREVVRMNARYTGRGPTSARATRGPDVIYVVLHGTLSKGEQLLLSDGRHKLVVEVRRAYHQAMRDTLAETAQAITGRDVLAVLADHCPEPDVSTISFVLAPQLAPVTPALALLDREPIRSAADRARVLQ